MSKYKDHDFLFKQLSKIAPEGLVQLTFPDLCEWLDLSESIMVTEGINDMAHMHNQLFYDTVLLCPPKGNTDEGNSNSVFVVHIEFQSYRQGEYHDKFAQRMFQYFCRLYGLYGDYFPYKREYKEYKGNKVEYIPLAILSDRCPVNTPDEFVLGSVEGELPFVSQYHYRKKHLKDFEWRETLLQRADNLAAIALVGKMKHHEEERPLMKYQSFYMLYSVHDPVESTKEVILAFIDEYLELNDEEEEVFEQHLINLMDSDDPLGGRIMEEYNGFKTKWGRMEAVNETKNHIVSLVAAILDGYTEEQVRHELNTELAHIDYKNREEVFQAITSQIKTLRSINEVREAMGNVFNFAW
ncbi:hypothetical protein [Halobacillus sp. B29]|uniref:hypothetical protein n=1 Tax=Halobacillus sp. B29 TaxID=3457432 RepID=UPI003FCE4B81